MCARVDDTKRMCPPFATILAIFTLYTYAYDGNGQKNIHRAYKKLYVHIKKKRKKKKKKN